jgi:pimeloyl-ACP methyl ester carboxylesterase
MSTATHVSPGVSIAPRVIETPAGAVEFDLTEGDGPVVLVSHAGVGGVDQARLMAAWLDPVEYRLLSVSRPGYLGTPLASGRSLEAQADLFAALLDTLQIGKAAVVTVSSGGPPGYLLAARHPDRVSALVAIDSVSGYHDIPETAGPVTQAVFSSRLGQKLFGTIARRKPEWLLRQLFQNDSYLNKRQIKQHIDFVLGSPDALAFMRALTETLNTFATRKEGTDNDSEHLRVLTRLPFELVRCPTLVVHGTHDADVKFYDGVYAYEHVTEAERFWIEDGSHLGFWLSPHAARAQAAARDFLGRLRPW